MCSTDNFHTKSMFSSFINHYIIKIQSETAESVACLFYGFGSSESLVIASFRY